MPQETSQRGTERVEPGAAPGAVLCHQIPGRFRLRVSERRSDEAYFAHVCEELEQQAVVVSVSTNPSTGSVLVFHGGDPGELFQHAESIGLFRITTERRETGTVVELLDALDRFDTDFLFARMNERPQRAATGLFMLAVLQALRGSFLPSAPSLLGEAMRLLREAGEDNRSKAGDP